MFQIGDGPTDAWLRLRTAGIVAGCAFLSAVPHLHYLTVIAFPERVRAQFSGLTTGEVLRLDLISIATLCVLASLVGSFFSERYELGGLGDLERTKKASRLILVVAPMIAAVTYFVFERRL